MNTRTLSLPGGRVLLRKGAEADTLDLLLIRDGVETAVRTLAQGRDYGKSDDLSLRPFSDILGSSGFLLRNTWGGSGGWGVNTYYALVPKGAVQVAETFGFDDDHAVDLNGDGIRELVCNCVYGGDGHQTVLVFQRWEDNIRLGRIDLGILPDHDNRGVNSTAARFDPKQNVFIVQYAVKDQKAPNVIEFSGLEHLRFSPYRPEA